jgi:hypothetical protein
LCLFRSYFTKSLQLNIKGWKDTCNFFTLAQLRFYMNGENSRLWTDYFKPQTATSYRNLRFRNRYKTAAIKYGKRLLCVNVSLHIQQQQQLLSSDLRICAQTVRNCKSQHLTARPAASAALKRTYTATEISHNVLKTHETLEIKS